jgi:two-component system, OmpR family, sensor kinase
VQAVKDLSGHVPLRIKLITAVVALVAIALAVISISSLVVFRNYLEDRADTQLRSLEQQAVSIISGPGPRGPALGLAGYVVELRDSQGQLVANTGNWQELSVPGPDVPTNKAWLTANAGKMVTVPAQSGQDTWRVITRPLKYFGVGPLGVPAGPSQVGTLIVGVDLGGNIDQAVSTLARVDLIVSVIVLAALIMVGVALVRASLRPLTDIERTAEAIAAGDLSRRVPDSDPNTEVGRLARSLNIMLGQIESAFRDRAQSEAAARRSEERMRQFVADASHELRTPLTAIRGYAEYYRQRGGVDNGSHPAGSPQPSREPTHGAAEADTVAADTAAAEVTAAGTAAAGTGGTPGPTLAGAAAGSGPLTTPDMDRIMERVEQESSRMGGLVQDMLMLARLDEQRPIERRPVDLLTLAADAVQDARIVAPGRKIDLTVGTGAAFLVQGDEARLRQVISNLMSNALTHTPEGTPVTVRILPGYQGTPAVPAAILEVADQGPGLTREQAERVFERFYRADQARGRRTGGTGLGLAIVAALVGAHDGTVGVNTAPGRGATFWITLPLAPEVTAD